jgi:putative ABC transport system permease protein
MSPRRSRQVTALRRRLRTGWVTLTGTGATASIAFGLLVFASVLASLAIPRESVGLATGALQRLIAAAPSGDWTVTATATTTSTTGEPAPVKDTDIAAEAAWIRSRLTAAGAPVASYPPAWSSLTTGFAQIAGAAQPAGYAQPQIELSYRAALARYSRVLAGQLPAAGAAGGAETGVAQIAVTTTTAARLGLRVGTRLHAGPLQMVVSGIIQPVLPASAFWSTDRLGARPLLVTSAKPAYWSGEVFVGGGVLPLIESSLNPLMNATWWYPAALGQLTAGQAGGLVTSLDSLVSAGETMTIPGLTGPVTVTVTTPIPSILAPYVTGQNAVAPVLELLYVSLAITGMVVALLGAQLVGQRRAAEFTLMRARGAALYQLGWLVLRASVVIAAVAGAAAAALAIALTPGGAGLAWASGHGGDALGWWLAGITIAVTVFGPVLISVVPQRVAAPAAGWAGGGGAARRSGGRKSPARRVIVETALIAVAIGGLVVLRDEGLSPGSSGLYQSAAPVLIAIPVAVVVLRCYPLLLRELARLAGRSRGVVAFVGLARATRTPPGTVLPSFALVLVLAMVAFPDMINTSVTRSEVAASWQQVGVDAIIQAPPQGVIPSALQDQISSIPGVVATVPAEVDNASLSTGFELSVVVVDPARYAAVVDHAPGPRFPLAALSGTTGNGVVPAVATAAGAPLIGPAPASLTVGIHTISIQLAGQINGVPGASGAVGNAIVVVPQQAFGGAPLDPNLMLVAGPGLDGARLSAAVNSELPGGSVTLRATALAALAGAPVPHAAQTALTQGIAAAAGFGVLVLLLSLLLSAQTRDMTLARLATMGLRRWQAQLLLATETLPPVVAAAVGGVACAWLLAPLVGPSLDIAAFSGTGAASGPAPAVVPLAASAAGLVLVALLVLAAQAVITYHRGSTRALRIAD